MAVSAVCIRRRRLVEAILSMHESVQDELCDFRNGIVVTDNGPDFGTSTACSAASQIADLRFDVYSVAGMINERDTVALAISDRSATIDDIAKCGYLFSLGGGEGSILVLSVSNPDIDLYAVSEAIKKIDHNALVSTWSRSDLPKS